MLIVWYDSKTRRGFTLIELLVVVVIIAILVGLSIPRLNDVRRRQKETQTATNLNDIQRALEQFGVDNNGNYPFRIVYFDQTTWSDPAFDPHTAVDTTAALHSDPQDFFSLGLIGGVRVVDSQFGDNTDEPFPGAIEGGIHEHKVIQPFGWDYNGWYRIFNQYSDPLKALGYIDSYPINPFFRRPMGAIMWNYGDANWISGGPVALDKTIPDPDVFPTPGDFVYTHFYRTNGTDIQDPEGVIPAAKSYQAKSESTQDDGLYYVDVVDGYHLWAYGMLPLNGSLYVAYPNNNAGLSTKGNQEANKDYDGSGTRDLYELGMIAYFKRTGAGSSSSSDSGGNRVEF
jgi:prepilin-type N-terminal cleavage/methylation domain-containing protein